MLRLTFELWLVLTLPDGAQRYSILDEGLTTEDCATIIPRLEPALTSGFTLVCEPAP